MDEYNGFNQISIKDKLKEIWYKYKKYIIISVCIIIVLIIVLSIILKQDKIDNTNLKYQSIETIMKLNAEKFVKNNNVTKDMYLSLNNLNLKIDNNLDCSSISGVLKENNNYYPYLVCKGYNSNTIKEILDSNESNKQYGTLKGDNPYILTSGEYVEEGYNINSKYTVNIKGNDIENGINVISYYILENNQYVAELKRIVIAEDIQGNEPVIELTGNKTRTIPQNSLYKEAGFKATDKLDGDITDKVQTIGTVDTSKPGTYTITYQVTNSKNKTTTVTRTVIVNQTEVALDITHTINPTTISYSGVTITLDIKGEGYSKTTLPTNEDVTTRNPSLTIRKNGTYEFIIYDTNGNSEVYEVKITNAQDQKPSITNLVVNAGIITVNAKKGENEIAGYYVSPVASITNGKEVTWITSNNSTFEIAKYPGTYYVYVKDNKNNISSGKSITFTLEDLYNQGPKSRTKTYLLSQELPSFLASRGDSIEKYNKFIADSVLSAGLFSNQGVVTAAIAATSYLYTKYQVQIPYISNITCTATRYNKHFGANPRWGILIASPGSQRAKECMGSYVGLDCASFVGWAVHNGGFTSYNTPGSYVHCSNRQQGLCAKYAISCAQLDENNFCIKMKSQTEAYNFYQDTTTGDLIYNKDHVVLILEHYDENKDGIKDGMYIMEAYSSVGIKKFSYQDLYNSKYDKVSKMENYYQHSANYACTATGISIPHSWTPVSSKFTNTQCTVKEG